MLIFDTASGLFFILITHGQIPVYAVNDQSAPDENICHGMDVGKCFIVHEYANDQHDGRCEILEKTDQGQSDFLNTETEQKERNYSHCSRAHHPQALRIHTERTVPAAWT